MRTLLRLQEARRVLLVLHPNLPIPYAPICFAMVKQSGRKPVPLIRPPRCTFQRPIMSPADDQRDFPGFPRTGTADPPSLICPQRLMTMWVFRKSLLQNKTLERLPSSHPFLPPLLMSYETIPNACGFHLPPTQNGD